MLKFVTPTALRNQVFPFSLYLNAYRTKHQNTFCSHYEGELMRLISGISEKIFICEEKA